MKTGIRSPTHCQHTVLRSALALSLPTAVADAVRTSLGPKGMDKMVCHRHVCFVALCVGRCDALRHTLAHTHSHSHSHSLTHTRTHSLAPQIQSSRGDVTITNDGATILSLMQVLHPAARMVRCVSPCSLRARQRLHSFPRTLQLVELSKAQDIEAGDGTTSVVVICGALLAAAEHLLNKGIHPSVISDAFQKASEKAMQILEAVRFERHTRTHRTRTPNKLTNTHSHTHDRFPPPWSSATVTHS